MWHMNSRTDELVRRDRIRAMAKQYLREFEPIAERSLAGVSLLCEVPANTPEITVERATKATRYLGLAM